MLSDYGGYKSFEVIIKFGGKGIVAAKFWEFPVDCPDDFDIVVFDELQIFFFIFF